MSNSYSPTGHIVSGFLNAAVSGINGHLSRVQQERLSEQNRELQVHLEKSRQHHQRELSLINIAANVQLEKNRQDFQLEQGRRTEELQRELSLINITANAKNARLAQEQQVRLFELNRDLQMEMEKNRQNFQLEQGRLNAELQRELSLKNHELRLTEQQANFENLCKQAEWNIFLKSWPLMNLPSVIRAEQILPDSTVSLRVFFARSSDPVFAKAVYPRVEQGLCEFVDLYHNEFRSKNIIFYHNGFSSEVSGGAVASNIHYALCELPVIIIDSNVLFDEICVSLTMWGFGSAEKSHFTVFKLPYEPHVANGSFSVKYYSELANQLLAHLKFILGYAYDAYNLIQYNRPPLLPRIARYEAGLGGRGCLLDEPEVEKAIWVKYEEIYSMVLGDSTPDGGQSFALLPDSFKGCVLHRLRMEYAGAMREYLTDEQFLQYLDDSVKAWSELRSSEPVEDFLRSLASGGKYVPDYVDGDDQQYLETLSALYDSVQLENCFGPLVKRISDLQKKTKDIQKDGCLQHYQIKYAEAMREYFTDEQFLQYLDGSVEAWTALHSNEPAKDFLRPSANGGKCAAAYCIGKDDRQYFETLCSLYGSVQNQSPYSLFVKEICVQLTFQMTVNKVYTASCGRNTVEGLVAFGQMKVGETYEIAGQNDGQECTAVVKCLAVSLRGSSEDDDCVVKCVLEGTGVDNIKCGQILMNSNIPAPAPAFTLETAAFLMSITFVSAGNNALEPFGSGISVTCLVERGELKDGQTVEFLGQPDDERRFAVVEISITCTTSIRAGNSGVCRLHVIGGSIRIERGQVLGKPGSGSAQSSVAPAPATQYEPTPPARRYKPAPRISDPWRGGYVAPSAPRPPAPSHKPPVSVPAFHTADGKAGQPFLMPVEDVFHISGHGIVATGLVERGQLRLGETVEIVGLANKKRTAVVAGIEMFRKIVDWAEAGDNIGVLFRGIDKNEIKRGQVLATPGSIQPHTRFVGQVYILSEHEGGRSTPFFNNYRPQFFFRTVDGVPGVITLLDGIEKGMPGGDVKMSVELITPIAIEKGLRFGIREGGRTVGAGTVIDIDE